jgi:hypothetical protein
VVPALLVAAGYFGVGPRIGKLPMDFGHSLENPSPSIPATTSTTNAKPSAAQVSANMAAPDVHVGVEPVSTVAPVVKPHRRRRHKKPAPPKDNIQGVPQDADPVTTSKTPPTTPPATTTDAGGSGGAATTGG